MSKLQIALGTVDAAHRRMRVVVLLSCMACSAVPLDRASEETPADGGPMAQADPATEKRETIAKPGRTGIDAAVGSLCDRDGDGHRAIPPPCNGDDCDDTDPRAHPGQDFLIDEPVEPLLGDWNCNDMVESKETGWMIDCAKLSVQACEKVSGFLGFPDCGQSDFYVRCEMIGNACAVGSADIQRQSCR